MINDLPEGQTQHDQTPACAASCAESANSTGGLESWKFEYTIENFGPEKLESGKKLCENEGCNYVADVIVEDGTAIYFACSLCVMKIPGANVLRSNVK